MKLPKARTENILEQNLVNETLIYDLTIDKAFNLNETSTIVYKACDGATTFDELKREHKFSDDFIYLALDELKRSNLLMDKNYVSSVAGINRRELIKKVGLATVLTLPLITSISAPSAIIAASTSCVPAREFHMYMDTPDPEDPEGSNCPNVRAEGRRVCCTGNYSLEDDSDPNNCLIQCR